MKRWALIPMVAIVLMLALFGAVSGADRIIRQGPVGDMFGLYRDFGTYYAPTVSLAPFDEVTGASQMIDVVHHEVHEGEMMHAEYAASVGNGSSLEMLFRTSANDAHTAFEVLAAGQMRTYLVEGATFSDAGTAVPAYNMNRTYTTTGAAEVYHTPTITTTGTYTLVNGRLLPGSTSPASRLGGSVRSNVEWILAPNTNYFLRVTNTSGSAAVVDVVLEWYEE